MYESDIGYCSKCSCPISLSSYDSSDSIGGYWFCLNCYENELERRAKVPTVSPPIGHQVSWEKIQGESSWMIPYDRGFGTLSKLQIGYRMVILGDHGFYSSEVKHIEEKGKEIVVTTTFSVYKIIELK
jgi:hypothetical protein